MGSARGDGKESLVPRVSPARVSRVLPRETTWDKSDKKAFCHFAALFTPLIAHHLPTAAIPWQKSWTVRSPLYFLVSCFSPGYVSFAV